MRYQLPLGVWSRSQSLRFEEDSDFGHMILLDCTFSLVLRGTRCTVVAGRATLLDTIVHLLLEEFRITLKSSLSTQSVCHTISPRVGVGVSQKTTSDYH